MTYVQFHDVHISLQSVRVYECKTCALKGTFIAYYAVWALLIVEGRTVTYSYLSL